jgi:hypothetical protein
MEDRLKIEERFRLPNFEAVVWHAAAMLVRGGRVPATVMLGLSALAQALKRWPASRLHASRIPEGIDPVEVILSR